MVKRKKQQYKADKIIIETVDGKLRLFEDVEVFTDDFTLHLLYATEGETTNSTFILSNIVVATVMGRTNAVDV